MNLFKYSTSHKDIANEIVNRCTRRGKLISTTAQVASRKCRAKNAGKMGSTQKRVEKGQDFHITYVGSCAKQQNLCARTAHQHPRRQINTTIVAPQP